RLTFLNRLPPSEGKAPVSFFIYADRSKILRVLSNLLGNAVKFTQGGSIEIQIEKNKTQLILKIKDSGIGIPENELSAVFDPFTQASNNPFRDARGTGLGLSIVKDFVKAHHGSIFVESTPTQGSCFTLWLPLEDHHVDKNKLDFSELVEEDSMNPTLLSSPSSFEELDLAPFARQVPGRSSLLIVEDTPQVLQALAYVLKEDYNL
ncbi:MAG TPA: hypothetical protein DF383_04725, partial [Deltaproteobacteria bacterium]|nr:hypothetical protein [Deltaproteobacteria bacterium]